MRVLGLSGGHYLPQEAASVVPQYQHDAAAVLVENGIVTAAIEEERLNRIKHTNRAPLYSPEFCLRTRGLSGRDIDHVAFYLNDAKLDDLARLTFLRNPGQPNLRNTRAELTQFLSQRFGITLPATHLHFVPHHLAHATSAFAMSGLDRSLVVTLDAEGDYDSGLVSIGEGNGSIRPIATVSLDNSIGYLYQNLIGFLGYKIFDEYKVMGLAPYGDPARYRAACAELYTLLPEGQWQLHRERILSLYGVMTPRRRGEEFTQAHKDFAAAVQATVEDIVFHLLRYQRASTEEHNLCLAGGLAHNCTINGKILASGLFEQVFVQPAAHDAGAALGAALRVYLDQRPPSPVALRTDRGAGVRTLEHLYWGTDTGSQTEIRNSLERWEDFVTFKRPDDLFRCVARLIADGNVVGWVQGRSEFGPRALGNRSIVADPRPRSHKELINAMVKKREAYRPFAPSVLVEDAHEYFALPPGVRELPYMVFVVGVREDKRALLGAVTHVDGSARVQTVSRSANERYWKLIAAFKQITGVPVLLNTSLNNHVEPIVDGVDDAVVCFLTTGLDYLAIGDWLVTKRNVGASMCAGLVPSIPPHYRLVHTKATGVDGMPYTTAQLVSTIDSKQQAQLSQPTYEMLLASDGRRTAAALCAGLGYDRELTAVVLEDIWELWSLRALILRPAAKPDAASIADWNETGHRVGTEIAAGA